ncbi:MAG TPA: glycosyltransferase [Candidatus Saccharimonadales bacterium]|nr:glycosyltransferase [Candidatus Saccharimonadales bacterium]
MLELWFVSFIAEAILLLLSLLWRWRRPLAALVAVFIVVTTFRLCLQLGWVIGFPFAFLAVFRVGNMLRIMKNRMHARYLKSATMRTSFVVFLFHPLIVSLLVLGAELGKHDSLRLMMIVQLTGAVIILATVVHNAFKLSFKKPEEYLSDSELPTVTVAIPARNETQELEECLNSLIANEYPKLEIIVLDDCSQDKTADVIRSFAQKGVRFVGGGPPADRWLAKNQAYEMLYREASGDLILFCGVDARFGPQAVRSMVNLMHARGKSMLSVLPSRSSSSPASAFIQPMRYWWELALPRRLFNRPAVLSTCWMIKRTSLKKLGGFAAVSHSILPEGFFARELVRTDSYSFVRSSNELDVMTVKPFAEQYMSAIRVRYPQIRRRPEWALLLTAANILFLLLPFVFFVISFWKADINTVVAGVTCLFLVVAHVIVVNITDPANSMLALVSFPVAAFSELIIGYSSMLRYEFFTVSWKDRNICIPVMHVVPRLPSVTADSE